MIPKHKAASVRRLKLSPGTIALLYVLFSIVWIWRTDLIVNAVQNPRTRLFLNTTKGIGFVLITAILLYLMIRKLVNQMRAAQRSLAASEAEYRGVVRGTNEGICRLTRQNRIGFVNPRLAAWLQRKEEDLVGRELSDFLDASERSVFAEQLQRWSSGSTAQHDFRLRAMDGTEITTIISGTPVFDPGSTYSGCVLMLTDITERLRMEYILQHSQKMEAVGRLAGGIAHDFNNLLGIIVGYATLLQSQFKEGDKGLEYAGSILGSCERTAALIKKLLAFSRKREQALLLAVIDLNEVVADFTKMLPFVIGVDVRITLLPAAEPVTVQADSGQIEQILMNLATNARDAMPKGGDLQIETGSVQDTSIHNARNVVPGRYSYLRVTDSGIGMSAETKDMIFEPFFTTKPPGKGTGLGLSVVYGIVKENKAYVEVESQPEHGTTFTIYFPYAEAPASEPPSPVRELPNRCGGETILLVEDEPMLRALTGQILTQEGYRIIEATDGRDALEIFKLRRSEVDLVLTDLAMPNLGGRELATRLLELDPALKILFISGYAGRPGSEALATDCIVVEKPFNPNVLLNAVRQCLDSNQSRASD